MAFTPEQETILAKIANKDKLGKELKKLQEDLVDLRTLMDGEIAEEEEKSKLAVDKVHEKYTPQIQDLNTEIQTKNEEITTIDT